MNYEDHSSLVSVLRGQQFLIITLGNAAPKDTQSRIVHAAAEAGVPYVMPNAYSPDPQNEAMLTQILVGVPYFKTVREIESLGVSSWIAFGCGFWYEWSIAGGGTDRFGVDAAERRVVFFDDGEEQITTTTWDQCGRGLAALLSLKLYPEDEADRSPAVDNWANRSLYIASFRVSQKDMFESVKRVTGTADADWKIEYVNSRERFREAQEAMKKGDPTGFNRQLYTRIFFPTGEGDHVRHGLANEVLGLPQEDIDEATKEGFRLRDLGKLSYD